MTREEKRTADLCDEIIARAARMMVADVGANIPMMLDRLLTYAAAQIVSMDGSRDAAQIFRRLADNIEAGAFATLEGKRGAVN